MAKKSNFLMLKCTVMTIPKELEFLTSSISVCKMGSCLEGSSIELENLLYEYGTRKSDADDLKWAQMECSEPFIISESDWKKAFDILN